MYLIEAYVTNASLNVNRPFTYIYSEPIERFCRIKVLFHNAENAAIVSACRYTDQSREEVEQEMGYRLLDVLEVIDTVPVISEELFDLAFWLSRTTLSPLISCLNSMLPKALKTSKKRIGPKMIRRFHLIEGDHSLSKRQQEVYDSLYEGIETAEARKISVSVIAKLIEKKAIVEYEEEASFSNEEIAQTAFKKLTPAQQKAYEGVIETEKMVSLLYGVTGSGKTEVYLHLARYYLSKNQDVLILVPEISLTPQMIERVKERFHDVVFYHSELSDQERYEQYKRVRDGEVKIVVGTRSAVFLPFHDLGLIIIDEEHDQSYKQDNMPCYQARNVAFRRAYTHHGKVLLASATPSLESYTRALKGDYQLLKLENRINLRLPEIEVVDLTKQIRKKNSYIISSDLDEELRRCLNNNKQAIILLNRRGYSPVVKCAECGTTLMCQDCDTPLNYHKDQNILKCHQCSRTYRIPKVCPNCGKPSLIYYGFGTKRVEEEMRERYPSARIGRMDRDSVSRKGAHSAILKQFEKKEIDILIGTQMIAKGLDYPDVTLVGILNADSGLMHQDYNSAKQTFDLLMQASGRSGRADSQGKVLIQAFNTDHYAIKAVLNQDYDYFYRIEMNYRNKASYPPYTHIIELILSDQNEERLDRSVSFLEEQIETMPYRHYRPCQLNKIQKQLRYRILIMGKDLPQMLKDVQKTIDLYLRNRNLSHLKADVDPLYLE